MRPRRHIDEVVERGPFQASWGSLKDYEPPAWYADGKFGIFIHWGAYSVPRVRQRMVPAQHVPARYSRVRAPPCDTRAAR